MEPVVAALDVGGTSIKAALIDRRGETVFSVRRPTGVERGAAALVSGIVELAAELAETAGVQVGAGGIVVPGTVDPIAGVARHAVNLGWHEPPLVDLIAARTGLPVALGHDGRLSGEIGHLVVRPGGPLCGCGNLGCLGAIASASRIAARYTVSTGLPAVSAAAVADLVRAGDPAAGSVRAEAVAALADALAAAAVLFDPARFVLGGGLSLAGATLVDPLTAALAARLTFREAPPISVSVLGDRAGVLGAALRAWGRLDGDTG